MAAPTSADLSTLLGRTIPQERGEVVIGIVQSMAKAHVRGGTGWVPNDEVSSVILSASARLASNTSGLLWDNTVGPESVSYRSAFTGWTLTERLTLDRYRKKAA